MTTTAISKLISIADSSKGSNVFWTRTKFQNVCYGKEMEVVEIMEMKWVVWVQSSSFEKREHRYLMGEEK